MDYVHGDYISSNRSPNGNEVQSIEVLKYTDASKQFSSKFWSGNNSVRRYEVHYIGPSKCFISNVINEISIKYVIIDLK
jgi:hypothetical protein